MTRAENERFHYRDYVRYRKSGDKNDKIHCKEPGKKHGKIRSNNENFNDGNYFQITQVLRKLCCQNILLLRLNLLLLLLLSL